MIRGDHVDGPVQQALDQRLPVLPAPQGRIHAEPPLLPQVVLRQQQVVGRRFAGDVGALRLCPADDLDALPAADVADVVGASGFLRQPDIPGDWAPFAFGADPLVPVRPGIPPVVDVSAGDEPLVLAVGREDPPQPPAGLHQGAHHALALDALPVVRKGNHPSGHPRQIRRLYPLFAHGQGAVGVHPAEAAAFPDQPFLFGQVIRRVRHRVQVRHGADVRVSSPGRRPAPGGDRLLIRKTRLAKMHMHIAKAGKNHRMGRPRAAQFLHQSILPSCILPTSPDWLQDPTAPRARIGFRKILYHNAFGMSMTSFGPDPCRSGKEVSPAPRRRARSSSAARDRHRFRPFGSKFSPDPSRMLPSPEKWSSPPAKKIAESVRTHCPEMRFGL